MGSWSLLLSDVASFELQSRQDRLAYPILRLKIETLNAGQVTECGPCEATVGSAHYICTLSLTAVGLGRTMYVQKRESRHHGPAVYFCAAIM